MKKTPIPPRLVLGGVYSTADLVNNLQVSDNTITLWTREGLRSCSHNTKTHFFLADDLVEFWKKQAFKAAKKLG